MSETTRDAHVAASDGEAACDAVEQGSLAAAVRTHQREPFTGFEREGNVLDDHARAIPCTKAADFQVAAAHRRPASVMIQRSHVAISAAAAITASGRVSRRRASRARGSGNGCSQRRLSLLTRMIAETNSNTAPSTAHIAMSNIAASAVDPSGIVNKIGSTARLTAFGRALANICRIGHWPSADSEGAGGLAPRTRGRGTYRDPGGTSVGFGAGTK